MFRRLLHRSATVVRHQSNYATKRYVLKQVQDDGTELIEWPQEHNKYFVVMKRQADGTKTVLWDQDEYENNNARHEEEKKKREEKADRILNVSLAAAFVGAYGLFIWALWE